jgi:hypothetical protein
MNLPGLPEDDAEPFTTYGLGQVHSRWRGLHVVRHSGGWSGYTAYLLRLPTERMAVAILCNVEEMDALPDKAEQIAEVVLDQRHRADRPTSAHCAQRRRAGIHRRVSPVAPTRG